jgi:hypothetical protein
MLLDAAGKDGAREGGSAGMGLPLSWCAWVPVFCAPCRVQTRSKNPLPHGFDSFQSPHFVRRSIPAEEVVHEDIHLGQENFRVMQGVDATVIAIGLLWILLGSEKWPFPEGFGAYLTFAVQPITSVFETTIPCLTLAS